jgi:hypothetical protein
MNEHNAYERRSQCCDAPVHSDIDICTRCKEWCDIIEEE